MSRKCYAASFGDCKGAMSREHYISDCMLPDNVIFHGGVKFAGRPIPKESAVSKILCQFHNSRLSPFDSEACSLLDAMNYPDKYESLSQEQRDTHGVINFEINGDKFEKWLMKTTINHLYQIDNDYINQAEACLEYLFKGKNFRKPSGIYGFQHGYICHRQRKGFMLFPLFGVNELCTGLLFFINDYPFVFFNNLHHGPPVAFMNWETDWMDEKFNQHLFYLQKLILENQIVYRPATLDIHLDDSFHKNICSINFKWTQGDS
jgi:hypothetical protein